MLDGSYRRVDRPGGDVLVPVFPTRYRSFLYACARVAAIHDGKAGDRAPNNPYVPPRRRRGAGSTAAGA